jgi:hypothetical protein
LTFSQGGQIIRFPDFELLDAQGNEICELIPPGEVRDVLVLLSEGTTLDFNTPFSILYEDQPVVSFPQPPSPPPCELVVSPLQLNFDNVEVGDSRDMSFQVTNSGQGTLTGSVAIALGSSFSIVSGGTLNLGPGQSQNVTIRFTPTQAGTEAASASVNSNCGSASVILSGTGIAAPEPPELAVSPSQLDFGTIPKGGSGTRDITVTNTGGGILEGQVVLNLQDGIPGLIGTFMLGPGEQKSFAVTVTIDPNDAGGPFSGTADITSNDRSIQIPVSGTVI